MSGNKDVTHSTADVNGVIDAYKVINQVVAALPTSRISSEDKANVRQVIVGVEHSPALLPHLIAIAARHGIKVAQ